jgi:hypothetical protein
MIYMSHIPSPPLNLYIDDLYYLDGPAPHSRLKTFPVPSLHLMVNFGQAFSVSLSDQAHPFATCSELDPFLEGTRTWKLSQGRDVKSVKTFCLS